MNVHEAIQALSIPVVDSLGSFSDGTSLLQFVRPLIGKEGVVLVFTDTGHRLKCKAEEYCKIHSTKDDIQNPRKILEVILAESLDDLYPLLDSLDLERVKKYEKMFWDQYARMLDYLETVLAEARDKYAGDRKRVALEFIPTLENKKVAKFIFDGLNGKDLEACLMDYVKKHSQSNSNYEELKSFLSLENLTVEYVYEE